MRGFEYRGGELFCEDVAVGGIVEAVGSPVYVYSAAALDGNLKECSEAFGPDTLVAASVKACPSLAVLNRYRAGGAGFDAVSGGEMSRALQVGARADQIVFAGVGKTDTELRDAIVAGILLINAESVAELENIDRVAGGLGRRAGVGLRLNPDVDAGTHAKTTTGKKENKFGIDPAAASAVLRAPGRFPNLIFRGIDAHLGSPINSVQPYALAMEKLVDFILAHRSAEAPLEYLDAGGGFGIVYRDQSPPSFAAYAEVLRKAAQAAGCRLIVEPGRSLAGNAAVLLCETQYVKDNGEKRFVIVDAGMNDLIRPAMYDAYHFCWPVRSVGVPPWAPMRDAGLDDPEALRYRRREDADADERPDLSADADGLVRADVVGPICESSDCFAKGRRLPAGVKRGDILAIFSAGAYGFSMSSTYNSRPRAAEVLVEGGRFRVIRERETYADLIRGERL